MKPRKPSKKYNKLIVVDEYVLKEIFKALGRALTVQLDKAGCPSREHICNVAGIFMSFLSEVESGFRFSTLETWFKITGAAGIPLCNIFNITVFQTSIPVTQEARKGKHLLKGSAWLLGWICLAIHCLL